MRKIRYLAQLGCLVCAFSAVFTVAASAANWQPSYTYTYSQDAKVQHSPDAFYPVKEFARFGNNDGFYQPEDLKTDKETGNIYVSDTGASRILIFDKNFELIRSIEEFTDSEGNIDMFSSPNGLCIHKDTLYVCDTGNERILSFDKKGNYKGSIGAPSSTVLPEDFMFRPLKVAIDMVDRFNIICENNTMGLVVLDQNGNFQGFTGSIKVTQSPMELFWRRFMTEKQLENSSRLIPSPYNNVYADEEGFIYATTSAYDDAYTIYNIVQTKDKSGNYSPIKRFSPSGADILVRNSTYQPVGELNFEVEFGNSEKGPSYIDGVTVTDNGVYTLMDTHYGKLFTYDGEGNLLYAFGGSGSKLGSFERLSAIDYFGENDNSLLALDSNANSITLFSKTEYGLLIDEAIAASRANDTEKAINCWKKIKEEENNNFDLAYQELGKNMVKEKNYEEAMGYFKYANDKTGYSSAYKMLRAQKMKSWAVIVPVIIVLIFMLVAKGFSAAKKYNIAHSQNIGKRPLKDQLIYGMHVVFHPFDGFWDLKNEKRGGVEGATVILILVTLSHVISFLATGFLFSQSSSSVMGIFSVVLGVVGPVLLWTVANWSLTSLMDGKGRMKEIYTATCYSTLPLLFVTVPIAVISNFLILDELVITATISVVSVLWMVILIYGSMVSTHDYSAGRSFLVCILTIIVIGFILFLCLLFYSTVEKLIDFILSLCTEASFRR